MLNVNETHTQAGYFTDSAAFLVLKILFVVYGLDATGIFWQGEIGRIFRYIYFLLILSLFVILLGRNFVVNRRPIHGILFLSLCFITGFAFALSLYYKSPESYASSLLPILALGIMAIIPNNRSYLDYKYLKNFLFKCALVFSTIHLLSQTLYFIELIPYRPTFERTFILCFFLCLSILERRGIFVLYALSLVALSLVLRPSSTLVAATAITVFTALLFRLGNNRAATLITGTLIVILLLGPIILLVAPKIFFLPIEFETTVKEFIGGKTNLSFRKATGLVARQEILAGSLLFGEWFLGNTRVYIGDLLPLYSVTENPNALIHNDLLSILKQGGLVGYFIFCSAVLGVYLCIVSSIVNGLRINDQHIVVLYQSICILLALFIIYISFNPTLQKYSVVFFFWFVFLLSGLGWRSLPYIVAVEPDRSQAYQA